MILRARHFEFRFPRPALVMGIVNVTPDSFSDGGAFLDSQRAVAHALALIAAGADIIDIGGESTRPGASPVSEADELARVLPVIRELAAVHRVAIPLSVDTMKPAVALAAVGAGAAIINDVAANRADVEPMARVVRDTRAGYVVMHMQGTPQTMQAAPAYGNVIAGVDDFFRERLERLRRAGVTPEQTILDPGIGFGKTCEHNLKLLAGLAQFRTHQRPLLLGASRKGFIGRVTGVKTTAERLPGSLACACAAANAGVEIIRAHDVAETRQALRMIEAIRAETD
jgi:dihydropteroate synthase